MRKLRVALVSTGLGRVLRGFESSTNSLFLALRRQVPEFDVTLFQGGGTPGERREVVPNFHRAGIPARLFDSLTASHWEKRSFALALYPSLRSGRYDVVHYNELMMGGLLLHLRRLFGGRYRLLYCNGAPAAPIDYHHRCDFAQVLTGPDQELAQQFGIPGDRLIPIPLGVDSGLFHPQRRRNRASIRAELGIPADATVVLSVAALKREHKRIDHVIREAAHLGKETWIVVAGQPTGETDDLATMAEQRMPGRWRFLSWPHERVADLYGAADVFTLCSLTEGLPLVTIEAMLSEVPVVLHNAPVFQWLGKGTSARLIDMSETGALAAALRSILDSSRNGTISPSDLALTRRVVESRFGWDALIPRYIDMYRHACSNALE